MRPERLQSLPACGVAFDTETWLIEPGNSHPEVVVGSAAWLEAGNRIGKQLLRGPGVGIDAKMPLLDSFATLLDTPDAVIIGANIGPFDFPVMIKKYASLGLDIFPEVFQAYEDGRVYDLQVAEALRAIGDGTLGRDPRTGGELKNPETGKPGSYSLSMCVSLVLGREDAKVNDEWKLRYRELDEKPVEQWPIEARDYPLDDAHNTLECALAQAGHLPKTALYHEWSEDGSHCTACLSTRASSTCMVRRPHLNQHEVATQTYSAFCLALGGAWGLCVDQQKVDVIEKYALQRRADSIKPFIDAGIIRSDGSEDQAVLKRLVAIAYGAEDPCPECTGTGRVPHGVQPQLRCPDCKGRCQPWKAGGKVKEPTVADCARCKNTAKVDHHNVKMTGCDPCCATGLVLTEHTPWTDGGDVGIGRDALHESGDEFLMSLGDYKEDAKILKDYVPWLRRGRVCLECGAHGTEGGKKASPHKEDCKRPGYCDVALTLSANAVLDTGRVSYRGYVQLLPRAPGYVVKDPGSPFHGKYIPSIRECIVARPPRREYVKIAEGSAVPEGWYAVEGAAA